MSEQTPASPAWRQPGNRFGSGLVTTAPGGPPGKPPPPLEPEPPQPGGPDRRRRQILIFGGIAGAILAIGLTVVLMLVFSAERNPFRDRVSAPTDVRPPLAQACPAPTGSPSAAPTRKPSALPPETGARTT
ncbi:MAG TPA: hypothetical protein VFG35_16860, partial [Actinoplanes sp.]|nr:hypothetical protein [Actinoplanes sp.]